MSLNDTFFVAIAILSTTATTQTTHRRIIYVALQPRGHPKNDVTIFPLLGRTPLQTSFNQKLSISHIFGPSRTAVPFRTFSEISPFSYSLLISKLVRLLMLLVAITTATTAATTTAQFLSRSRISTFLSSSSVSQMKNLLAYIFLSSHQQRGRS